MITLFDDERLRELRRDYEKSRLFCSLFPGLAELERRYGELSPTQVWHEMEVFCAGRLLGATALEMEVIDLWNTLLKRYEAFTTPDGQIIHRSPNQAVYTAVCVMTCVCFRLVAEPDVLFTWNSKEAAKEILRLIACHPVHRYLYMAQRRREERLEEAGRMIERGPWLNGVDSRQARKEIRKAEGAADVELKTWFNSLFKEVSLEQWTAFVHGCEAGMTFQCQIDRMAYLVMASHKNWLKGRRSIRLETWVNLMNHLLGDGKKMQPPEVSRKWNEMKNEKFYEGLHWLNECTEFESKNISASFFDRLRENVKLMHQINTSNK